MLINTYPHIDQVNGGNIISQSLTGLHIRSTTNTEIPQWRKTFVYYLHVYNNRLECWSLQRRDVAINYQKRENTNGILFIHSVHDH